MSKPGGRAPRRSRIRPARPIEEILEEEVRAPRAAVPDKQEPTIAGILQALGVIRDLMEQQVRNQNAAAAAKVPQGNMPAGVANEGRQAQKLVEQFLKLRPPKFAGSGDPEAAISWIEKLEKAFALLRCTDEDKVTLAVYQLQSNASTWWRASKDRVFPEGIVPTWDAFVGAFNGKYFSDTARKQKMEKFLRLRQNQLSVDKYEARFAELSKYAPRMIEDPVDKARRFRDGLKPEIKSVLMPLNLKDYDDLYERAQMVERDLAERAAATGSRFVPLHKRDIRQGKRPMPSDRHHIQPNRRGAISKPVFRQDGVCHLCRQRHGLGSCPFRGGACFGCGQFGHQVRDCHQRQPSKLQSICGMPIYECRSHEEPRWEDYQREDKGTRNDYVLQWLLPPRGPNHAGQSGASVGPGASFAIPRPTFSQSSPFSSTTASDAFSSAPASSGSVWSLFPSSPSSDLSTNADAIGQTNVSPHKIIFTETGSSVQYGISSMPECPVCLTNPKNMAFGCGHMTCGECARRLSSCPICRQPITIRLGVYT